MRPLSDADYILVRDYLRGTAGLEFDDSRRASLTGVMAERLRASGRTDVASYLTFLDRPDGAAERQHLLDDVTIQETHFHRARPQIDALRDHLLPQALQQAAAQGRGITVWSAGCSTGEEPYTLAMLALEARERMPLQPGEIAPQIRVVGTDVSAAALEVARAARYSGRTIDLADQGAVARWLRPAGDGNHVVRDEVRALVDFEHHNLVTEPAPFVDGTVDLVVCRNVTIYFSRETTRTLVGRFREVLTPGGSLLMGPAETLWQLSDAFALVAVGEAFAYRPAVVRPVAVATFLPDAPPVRRSPDRVSPIGPTPAQPTILVSSPARKSPGPTTPPRDGAQSSGQPGVEPSVEPSVESSVESRRPTTATELLAQAHVALESTRYADAAGLAAQAAAADPLLTDAYVVCGQAYATLGQDALALGPLGRAVYLDAKAGHAWFLLAGSLGRTGDRAGAARAYRAAAAALPQAPPEAVLGLLDGTPVDQLVQLCTHLADDLEGTSQPSTRASLEEQELRRGA